MKTDFTVLVADRNPHVRCFLKRELTAEGFHVLTAENGQEILKWSFSPIPIDAAIIDPDLPDMDAGTLINKLCMRVPIFPIVLHTLPGEEHPSEIPDTIFCIEKDGQSIDRLKTIIDSLRFPKKPNHEPI